MKQINVHFTDEEFRALMKVKDKVREGKISWHDLILLMILKEEN